MSYGGIAPSSQGWRRYPEHAGGRIVLEVFHGLLDSDPTSYRNYSAAGAWKPLIAGFQMWNVVNRVLLP